MKGRSRPTSTPSGPTAPPATTRARSSRTRSMRSTRTRSASTPPGRSICGAALSARSRPPPPPSRPPRRRDAPPCSRAWRRSRAITSQLRGVQTQLRIARDNLKTAQQSLQLTQQRAEGGVTTDLDVANASAQVRTTAAQIPGWEQQEAQQINALSLLLGQPPNALRSELATARPVPPVPPRVPVGLPSELARRRPDVVQAEAQLHAATATIGVAVAAFYPSVTLIGQRRAAGAAALADVQPELAASTVPARASPSRSSRAVSSRRRCICARRSRRRPRSTTRRPCCKPGTTWTMR